MRPLGNFLVTRFSLRILDWAQKAYGDESQREPWFAARASMFATGLFASVRVQTRPVNGHFLLMDEEDEPLYARYLDLGEPLIPVFTRNARSHVVVSEEIARCAPSGSAVAVSRVDSDDLIACDYVEHLDQAIQAALNRGLRFDFVVATDGFVTDFDRIQAVHHPTSPFLTQFAARWEGQKLFGFSHRQIGERPHIVCDRASWMICLHGSNLLNRFMAESEVEVSAVRRRRHKKHASPLVPARTNWPKQFVCPPQWKHESESPRSDC